MLDWPTEYLTSISGTVAVYSNHTVIHSLRFYTNKTEYGPYGSEKGTPFSLPMEGGVIVGFHGRAGHYVDAIGVYVKTMQREVWFLKVVVLLLLLLSNLLKLGRTERCYILMTKLFNLYNI